MVPATHWSGNFLGFGGNFMGDLGNLMGFSRVLIGDSLGLEKAKRPLAETYCMPLYDTYIYIY